jgi:hypothetical protein
METRDLDTIRFVTQRFNELQGLRSLVPLGLIALCGVGATHFTSWPVALLRAALFLGAFSLMLRAGRYYQRSFGEVERPPVYLAAEASPLSIFSPAGVAPRLEATRTAIPGTRRVILMLGMAPSLYLLFQFLFWPPWIKIHSDLVYEPFWNNVPLSSPEVLALVAPLLYALSGSLFLGLWWSRERRLCQAHHLALGILLAGLAVTGTGAVSRPGAALFLCGAATVVAGLLDHWQLVRVLGRPLSSREGE